MEVTSTLITGTGEYFFGSTEETSAPGGDVETSETGAEVISVPFKSYPITAIYSSGT